MYFGNVHKHMIFLIKNIIAINFVGTEHCSVPTFHYINKLIIYIFYKIYLKNKNLFIIFIIFVIIKI